MSEQSSEIQDLEINAADAESVVGGASVGPVHPLVPEAEGIIANVTQPARPIGHPL